MMFNDHVLASPRAVANARDFDLGHVPRNARNILGNIDYPALASDTAGNSVRR
jgi:hypothetical protein